MGLGGVVVGSPILYLKGMGILMFQLSGFYCNDIVEGAVMPGSRINNYSRSVLVLNLLVQYPGESKKLTFLSQQLVSMRYLDSLLLSSARSDLSQVGPHSCSPALWHYVFDMSDIPGQECLTTPKGQSSQLPLIRVDQNVSPFSSYSRSSLAVEALWLRALCLASAAR